jgi:hypothetical protein
LKVFNFTTSDTYSGTYSWRLARGYKKLKQNIATLSTSIEIALASGPTFPPVSHAGPWTDELSKVRDAA